MKTFLRLLGGILCGLVYGARNHVNLGLRIGPIQVHVAAVMTHEANGNCHGSCFQLLEDLFDKWGALAWDDNSQDGDRPWGVLP